MVLKLNTSATGANVLGQVNDFPVLVRLDAGNFDFSQAKDNGTDVRFSRQSPGGAALELPCQIDTWDQSNKVAAIWVRVDTVRGDNAEQAIVMHWGHPLPPASTSGPVFSTANGFRAVWHLTQSPGEASGGFKDSTPNGYHATGNGGMPANSPTPGIIGNAQWFDGATDYIQIPTLPNCSTTTVSAWYNMDAVKSHAGILSNGQWASGVVHFKNNNGTLVASANSGTEAQKTGQVTGTWYMATYTFSKNGPVSLYVNGALVSTGSAPASDWKGTNLEIGHENSSYSSGTRYFKGTIDEPRVETVVRSADWIKLGYENQKASQKLVQFIFLPLSHTGGKVYGDFDLDSYSVLNIGTMTTKSWKVATPDYVFEPSYPLPSLEEVSSFIQRHHHLPGISSAREMESEGMDLGTLNLLMLKQIEHMNLYLIDQDKRVRGLEAKKAGKP